MPEPCPCEAGVRPSTAYRRGCRCAPARTWKARYTKRRAHGLQPAAYTDGTGTARRLQALAAAGWTTEVLARRLGMSVSTVGKLRFGANPRVRADNAARIRALYDRLWDLPGPSEHMRQRAALHRWAPALAWDDDTIDDPTARPDRGPRFAGRAAPVDPVAVERLVAGQAVRAGGASVAAAMDVLERRGWTVAATAAQLRISERTVERRRARARITDTGKAA